MIGAFVTCTHQRKEVNASQYMVKWLGFRVRYRVRNAVKAEALGAAVHHPSRSTSFNRLCVVI